MGKHFSEVASIVYEITSEPGRDRCQRIYGEILKRSQDDTLLPEVRDCLSTLGRVASYHFRPGDTHRPLHPMFQLPDGRSAAPEDLSKAELELLKDLYDIVSPTELKARINDVLWLNEKQLKHAEAAIQEYLRCSQGFDLNEDWLFCVDLAERALRLGSLFRRQRPELCQSAADVMLAWVEGNSETDEKLLVARVVPLLLKFGYGEPVSFHRLATASASAAEQANDYHRAEQYRRLAVHTAQSAKDEEAEQKARYALAKCYALRARSIDSSGTQAAHSMQQAVEALTNVPGAKKKRESYYSELIQYQKASLSEMGQIEQPIDLSSAIKEAVGRVAGQSARDALFTLSFGFSGIPDYSRLEQEAAERASRFPFSSMFGAYDVDHEGKVIAKSPGGFGDPERISEREIYRDAALWHHIFVFGTVLPAVDIIVTEHTLSEDDFLAATVNNPFVMPGQERLYAKGLLAGLEKDFVTATAILVPLVENSIRHVLRSKGVRVSTLLPSGVQEDMRIGTLLEHEKSAEILEKDVVMDLKGLLIDRTYANLRNKLAHGLVTIGTFQMPCVVYLWWLVLRLCLTPHFLREKDRSGNE